MDDPLVEFISFNRKRRKIKLEINSINRLTVKLKLDIALLYIFMSYLLQVDDTEIKY